MLKRRGKHEEKILPIPLTNQKHRNNVKMYNLKQTVLDCTIPV